MQIVIELSENDYELACKYPDGLLGVYTRAIKNGTPIPEGHGDLIDRDEILKAIDTWDKFGYTQTGRFVKEPKNVYVPYVHYEDMVKSISNAPTIIESDLGQIDTN